MRTVGNIIWHFPLFGFITSFLTFLIGLFFLATIIGAPIGMGLIQLSKFLLTPFSSHMIKQKKVKKINNLWLVYGFIVRVIYFPFGLVLATITIVQIVALFVSIVGVPVAIVLYKSLGTIFNPVHKIVVSNTVAKKLNI